MVSLFTTCFWGSVLSRVWLRWDTMRDDNEGVMERGWKTFVRVTKCCIKGGVYTLLNMILVNRENPTMNGVDYHNAVRATLLHWTGRIACSQLHWTGRIACSQLHWTGHIACSHPKQLSDFEAKIRKGISLKCVAPFGVLHSVYLCDVETVFSRLGYFCSKEPKCSLPSQQKCPTHPITDPFQFTLPSRNIFLYNQF